MAHSQLGFFFFCDVERRQTPMTIKISSMTTIPLTAPTIARISIKSSVQHGKNERYNTHTHTHILYLYTHRVLGWGVEGALVVNGPFTLTFWHQRDFDRVGPVVVVSRAVVHSELLVP